MKLRLHDLRLDSENGTKMRVIRRLRVPNGIQWLAVGRNENHDSDLFGLYNSFGERISGTAPGNLILVNQGRPYVLWDKINPRARFVARDACGRWYWYARQPVAGRNIWKIEDTVDDGIWYPAGEALWGIISRHRECIWNFDNPMDWRETMITKRA